MSELPAGVGGEQDQTFVEIKTSSTGVPGLYELVIAGLKVLHELAAGLKFILT